MSDHKNSYPVLWDTTAERSAFDPVDWFAHCEAVQGRPVPRVPRYAIQTVIPAHMDIVCERYGVGPDDYAMSNHPFAIFEHDGVAMVIATSSKGSYASGGLDELVSMGAKHAIFLGGSGAISEAIMVDDLFVPTKALRDECVSYHYIAPSRYAYPSTKLTTLLLEEGQRQCDRVKSGPMWTIMAHFRQAIPRLERIRDEGCLVVNNEASPHFAVGQARGIETAALLNVGDTLASGRFIVPEGHPQLYQRDDVTLQLDIAIQTLARVAREDANEQDGA
ncbi:hypothetical protein KUV64_14730 [Mameliella alba]|uniref:phosphorylase family protein n=1 Tax=Mameliella alba TaxID=561184 RepID=UPI001C98AE56|nr:hypothetical protein [Mameliella alba]MBY6120387.1 hypothetical protein [Mameliella alba]